MVIRLKHGLQSKICFRGMIGLDKRTIRYMQAELRELSKSSEKLSAKNLVAQAKSLVSPNLAFAHA